MKLIVIGLGKMGIEIVTNLLRSGHDVTVYNRTADKARALEFRAAQERSWHFKNQSHMPRSYLAATVATLAFKSAQLENIVTKQFSNLGLKNNA